MRSTFARALTTALATGVALGAIALPKLALGDAGGQVPRLFAVPASPDGAVIRVAAPPKPTSKPTSESKPKRAPQQAPAPRPTPPSVRRTAGVAPAPLAEPAVQRNHVKDEKGKHEKVKHEKVKGKHKKDKGKHKKDKGKHKKDKGHKAKLGKGHGKRGGKHG